MNESQASPPRSRISEPVRAHPLCKRLYREMAARGVTYDAMEAESGVQKSTFKALRTANSPGVNSLQRLLQVVGHNLLPLPAAETLPPPLLADLGAITARHGLSEPPIAGLIAVAAERSSA